MSRRRYRRRGGNSLGAVVDDSVHIAARFGPLGALTTGAVGFAIFYALLPVVLLAWTDANKAKLIGPAAAVFSKLLDQVMWQRFISPCQWVGAAIVLACRAIAVWKVISERELLAEQQEAALPHLQAALFGLPHAIRLLTAPLVR